MPINAFIVSCILTEFIHIAESLIKVDPEVEVNVIFKDFQNGPPSGAEVQHFSEHAVES